MKNKILFVCHGNICRSPMAEFVMKRLVDDAGCADASGNLGGIVRVLGTKYNVMENCHNYGNVKGTTRVGGLVGWAETNSGATLTMTNCSNHGKIENYSNGNEACVGGLVGNLSCTITYCYNTGEVKGYLKVGGIIAIGGTVSYCYNVGQRAHGRR